MGIITKFMQLWSEWEVRLCVMCSLFLQIFLVFFASYRKRKSNTAGVIRVFTWLAYLLADMVATFSLGQLSNAIVTRNSKDKNLDRTYDDEYNDLVAFWAPFLLLHLGGPDPITAFALEDNELWLRHFLYLGIRLFASGYVFVRSFPNGTLIIPTLLLFVAGTIKYLERTMALYLASNVGFKTTIPKVRDPGTNFKVLMEEYVLDREAGLPTRIKPPDEFPLETSIEDIGKGPEEVPNEEIVAKAYEYFKTFKRIIIDLLLNFNETKQSRAFLLNQSAKQAFTMIHIQLGLVYDILYTKAAVVHTKLGYATHATSFFLILAAFFLFVPLHAHKIKREDMVVTYTLLGSALALELVSLSKLIFSPWTYAFLNKKNKFKLIRSLIGKLIISRSERHIRISQYNLINSCTWDHRQCKFIRKISEHWCFTRFRDQFILVKRETAGEELIDFIFQELKMKSNAAINFEMTKQLASSRGSWALEQRARFKDFGWTVTVEFEESILLWHIATDLCYNISDSNFDDAFSKIPPNIDDSDSESDSDTLPISAAKLRRVSKLISEYMLYLLVLHPSMISSMEGLRQIKYQEAYDEIMCYIEAVGQTKEDGENTNNGTEDSARKKLLQLSAEMEMKQRTELVLFDACRLIKQLNFLKKRRRWGLISRVWFELLSYAASHCGAKHHTEGLIRGGELLTHVWFLMAQMGLGQQYYHVSGHASAKLNVDPA